MRNHLPLEGRFDSRCLAEILSWEERAAGGTSAELSVSYKGLHNGGSCRGEIPVWEEQHGKPGTIPETRRVLLAFTSSSPGAHQPESRCQPFLLAFLLRALAEARRGRPGSAAAAAARGEGRGGSGASPSSALPASPLLLPALSARDQPCCFSASKPKHHPPFAPPSPSPCLLQRIN